MSHNTLYTLLVDTADQLVEENEDYSSISKCQPMTKDKTITFLESHFEESITILLPKHAESLPADFQGQLKHLRKSYKSHLKSFLMNSFSLKSLMDLTKSGKCCKHGNDFIQRLHLVNNIINGSSSEELRGDMIGKLVENNPMPSIPRGLMKSEKNNHSTDLDIHLDNTRNENVEHYLNSIENVLQECIQSMAEQIRNPTSDLFEKSRAKYKESLAALEALKNSRNISKNTEKKLLEKIKTFTIKQTCINEIFQLEILIGTKFAEQLYYPIDEFNNWVDKTKTNSLINVKTTRSTEIPPWFEYYLDIILSEARILNKSIRESEERAVKEAISTALGFYKEKMKTQTDLLIFKLKDLEDVDGKTINIVKQSLEYAMKLENRKNIALVDFDALLKLSQEANIILEDLKSESMHKIYAVLPEKAKNAASKAFKTYQTQLEEDIKNITSLKVTKLYEFHASARDKAVCIFYKELSSVPTELIEPFSKDLSEDINREHKRIRDAKVNDANKSIASALSILGIQFGLADIRFGVYRNGNPQLYKQTKGKYEIPNFINLSDGICIGEIAEQLFQNRKGGFKMENILLDSVGKVYETNVMGTSQKLNLHVIVALIFEYIKSTAISFFNEDICKCVISVPNAFDYVQRQMVEDSASLAGFEVVSILSESAAAAVTVRFAPEFKRQFDATQNVNLLVQCHKTYSEIDSSSIFSVKQGGIKMLSSCSPAILGDLKKKGVYQSFKNLIYGSPTDIQIILHDAIEKSKAEVNCGIIIKSGQSKYILNPDKCTIKDFCSNILPAAVSTSVVHGSIYYAQELKSGRQFSVSETLQYKVILEVDKTKSTLFERNSLLPLSKEITFALPSCPLDLWKFPGEHSRLGKYSIDARHKSALYNRGQMAFNLDHSGLLSTKGCLLTNNGKEEMYVTQQTENINEQKRREITEKLKEIHSMEKNIDAQKRLRDELQKEFERMKNLIGRATLSQAVKRALGRTIEMCQDVLGDKNSTTGLLTQQLEALKQAEEVFLK